jgi:hypothetical protein
VGKVEDMSLLLKREILILASITCGLMVSSHAYAQSDQPQEPYVVVGVDCNDEEHVKALLDDAAITARKDKAIIIIARLGTGERSRKNIRHRLLITSAYLRDVRGVPRDRIITAEGERVRGLGHVEIYVGGRLNILFKMKRDKGFGGCAPDH